MVLKYDFAGERHPCKYNPNLSINIKYLILNVSNAGIDAFFPVMLLLVQRVGNMAPASSLAAVQSKSNPKKPTLS